MTVKQYLAKYFTKLAAFAAFALGINVGMVVVNLILTPPFDECIKVAEECGGLLEECYSLPPLPCPSAEAIKALGQATAVCGAAERACSDE